MSADGGMSCRRQHGGTERSKSKAECKRPRRTNCKDGGAGEDQLGTYEQKLATRDQSVRGILSALKGTKQKKGNKRSTT